MSKILNLLNINLSKVDVLLGKQKNIKAKNYQFDNMHARLQRGNYNKDTNSGVLLERHKTNKNASIMAISGVSNYSLNLFSGSNPSNDILKKVSTWFSHLTDEDLKNTDLLELKFLLFLEEINNDLSQTTATPTSSLACAIVGEKNTILVTIGDTFVYINKNGIVDEAVKNDLLVTKYSINYAGYTKSQLKNLFENGLGTRNFGYPNIRIVENDYDSIILTSKMVGGNLSIEEINKIVKDNPDTMITQELIRKSATSYLQEENKEPDDFPGQDDLIVALSKKKTR